MAFAVLPRYWEAGWLRLLVGFLLVGLGGASAWSWSRRQMARALERERVAHQLQALRQELAHSSRVIRDV